VGFHFDPVVLDSGWYGEYRETARRLFEAVDPKSIAWISLGTLRMSPRFLEEAVASSSSHPSLFGELVPAPDGKRRYFWPLRRAAYRALARVLRRLGGEDLPIYLCMESPEMWGAALGEVPPEDALVRRLLRRFD
jgi:spore photoproduct lyase